MNPIFAALAQGFEEDEILNFMMKTIPKLAPRVRRAKKQRHSPKKILEYISRSIDQEAGDELQASNAISAKQKKRSNEITKGLLKEGLKLGTMAFGAGLLVKAAPQLLSRLPLIGRMFGGAETAEAAGAAQAVAGAGEALGGAEAAAGGEILGAEGLEAANLTIAAEKEALKAAEAGLTENQLLGRRYLDKEKLGNRLKTMKKAGKSREQMVDYLKKKMPMIDQEYIRSIGFSGEPGDLDERLMEMVDAYFPLSAKKGIEETATEQISEKVTDIGGAEVLEETAKVKEVEKPVWGSTVITPEGDLATVEELPGKTAKLNIEGKKKVVRSEDLVSSPITKDELGQLYTDLLAGIETVTGQEVSRNVNLAGYDAANNELSYTPHSGTTYVYDKIPQDAVDELMSLGFRKTSGENYVGAWDEGTESPIGAAISKLILRLMKERGRGKEFSRKYVSLYDALKPAREAAKALHKRRKKGD